MLRDHRVRHRIVEYLTAHGPIEDAGGKATTVLKKAIVYDGSDAGFSQAVAAMVKAGLLEREIRGKRTYRIMLGAGGETNGGAVSNPTDAQLLDYEEMAVALLAQAIHALATPEHQAETVLSARRRLEQLEARNATFQRDLARAKAASAVVINERDALKDQLEAVQHNLTLLTERVQEPSRPQGRTPERLGPEEQTLLHQLRRRRPNVPVQDDCNEQAGSAF